MKHFKTTLLQASFIAITLLVTSSCGDNQNAEDSKKIAEEHNEAKFENPNAERDAQFLVNAAEINMEEIRLGQLAQQNCMMTEVKELGKMMETDHAKCLSDLTDLASKKSMSLPTTPSDKAEDTYKKLSSKTGMRFDKEYCEMMVNGHKGAIEMFEKASTECNDAEIKSWAIATLPALRAHLDHAIDCEKSCEKKYSQK